MQTGEGTILFPDLFCGTFRVFEITTSITKRGFEIWICQVATFEQERRCAVWAKHRKLGLRYSAWKMRSPGEFDVCAGLTE